MSSLPSELDFDKDRSATPDRMNRAMDYIIARLRALESSQPEFSAAVEELRRLMLDRMAEVLIPAYQQVNTIRQELEAIQTEWVDAGFGDALAAALLAQVWSRAQADGRFAAIAHDHGIADIDGLSAEILAITNAIGSLTDDLSGKAAAASPTLSGAIYANGSQRANVTAMAALNIDCAAGNYFTKTIAGNSTFTVSNVPASRSYGFTLELTHTSGTVTWFSGVQWPNGAAPSLTTGKVHLFIFHTDDGGATWRGAALANYSS
ncbi:hypothetical protein FHS51_001734 [Sphingobium wenxiniae]|uniref:Uncharacterized protein n=1 Tax=Sphingobium wenxiniae (strain DSM 21828 / CGMCC 1.7748 / JZ-1) TaxID=595605 RepID=A0A562KDA6_SPHWJ|nr:hypothetical protein [Sphingobium wenxiniae]MBB6191507.1 hypothetical protein [Sphingobium wenxiniae]TWH93203.1 hypothetical protein IQ35_02110 [Sphingobium wenxiniae]